MDELRRVVEVNLISVIDLCLHTSPILAPQTVHAY
jgi:hypothetical protein